MLYRNPLTIKGYEKEPFGDPFVFRWNGHYYLFCSTEGGDDRIRCYQSEDLVHWVFDAYAAEDPILKDAYAPEIIYAYHRFYLVTSPEGNGHYIYVSDKVDGPYSRLTDNLGSMIDGSFFVDGKGGLHLLRADHNGVALLDVSEQGELTQRRNIPLRLGAWTEGPGLFQRGDYYYLTYCGNNLFSKGYRVAYATSKTLASSYRPGINNPLLLHTGKGLTRLGHSSTVLAPDLDGYYVVYHEMENKEGRFQPRRFLVDRARFSGSLMSVNATEISLKAPLKPAFASAKPLADRNYFHAGSLHLAKRNLTKRFTLETTFAGLGTSLIFGYVDEKHFTELLFQKRSYSLVRHQGKPTLLAQGDMAFDFSYLHAVRLAVGEVTRLFVDNALTATLPPLPRGRFGFIAPHSQILYTAFSAFSDGQSDLRYPVPLPGILDASHALPEKGLAYDTEDGVGFKTLSQESFDYVAKKGRYNLTLFARVKKEAVLGINGRTVVVHATPSEYDWISYDLGAFDFEEKGKLVLRCLKGRLDYKFLTVDAYEDLSVKDNFAHEGKTLLSVEGQDSYHLGTIQSASFHAQVKFTLSKIDPYGTFGLILGAHDYSNHCPQARYPLEGYLVGFEGSLLILDRLDYGRTRVFDRPVSLQAAEEHLLEASFANGAFVVSLDHQILITTTVSDIAHLGTTGLFASDGCYVRLSEVQ